jgi:hypothetical protein
MGGRVEINRACEHTSDLVNSEGDRIALAKVLWIVFLLQASVLARFEHED